MYMFGSSAAAHTGSSPLPTWARAICLASALGLWFAAPGVGQAAPPAPVPVQPVDDWTQFPLVPDADPFYSPPADVIAKSEPGAIIAARKVRLAHLSVLPVGGIESWQLSFRSNDGAGNPIAAVTTVVKPLDGGDDAQRPLLSAQFMEDSLGTQCAPSYQLQFGSIPSPITGSSFVSIDFALAQTSLAQGWALAIPDHQGPRSALSAGPISGKITLDGIRAAENFAPLGLAGTDTKVGLAGYSGGTIPTNFAAELEDSYAPELDIVGASSGAILADFEPGLDGGTRQLGAGIWMSGMFGLARDNPPLARFMDEHLNPLGKAFQNYQGGTCAQFSAPLAFVDIKGLFDVPGDPLDYPEFRAALDANRMGSITPSTPMYLYHANPDWLVPVGPVNELYADYCSRPGATVEYTRDNFSEHLSLAVSAAPSVFMWMRDRFAGVPAASGCQFHDVGSMALDDAAWPAFSDAVGAAAAALWKPVS